MSDVEALSDSSQRLTQAERRERSHQELLEATMRVVSKQGVAGATFEAIAREAGFSRGLVTQRFGSKDGLIRALIDGLYNWQQSALDAAHVRSMDGLSALCAFVELHCRTLEGHEEDKAYYMLLAAAVADRLDIREAFADSHAVQRVLIRRIIERGQEDGSVRPDVDADATALMAGCALIGIRMQNLIDASTDIAPIRHSLIGALRAQLAP
ncbi:TetR/AcrR family transcriptional regulator [Henriciella sp. AS95]|uniref:TetR/AcrR family transcriptional regulator n=1 Tax=Henriciella sp. AS95 TaxID=3135782 RepID=UPI003174A841